MVAALAFGDAVFGDVDEIDVVDEVFFLPFVLVAAFAAADVEDFEAFVGFGAEGFDRLVDRVFDLWGEGLPRKLKIERLRCLYR